MPLIATHDLTPESIAQMGDSHRKWVYNGLDCCVTQEVLGEIGKQTNFPREIYDFERALQAPAMEMMLRGFKVDQFERQQAMAEFSKSIARLDFQLQKLAHAVWDKPLNPNSHIQVKDFFYKAMGLPEVWLSQKGERKLSSNREALEKLSAYLYARPITDTILALRETKKLLSTLESEVDSDGRMRTSYNVAGTETGRWSSSASPFGTGTNLQNWTQRLRRVFMADAGWKLCVIDLEQAESRDVGFICGTLFGDWSYLDACESGDLHTLTARMIWPHLAWTGDPKKDRALADQIFYRDFSYRDMSKRGGHGSNYYGTPITMSRHLKVPVAFMADFQQGYFRAFPGIPRWHRWTAQQLQTVQSLTTPFGRERTFFGRATDDSTLREAIAYVPQSSTADRTNLGLYRIWKHMGKEVQLLAQTHDSVTFQYQPKHEADIIKTALAHMRVTLTAPNNRTFTIPGEAKVGWNWGNHHQPDKPLGPKNRYNPNGLTKWKGIDTRERLVGLDRPIS